MPVGHSTGMGLFQSPDIPSGICIGILPRAATMPIYQFLDPENRIVEQYYPSARLAPDVGKEAVIGGLKCIRIISSGMQVGARTKEMCQGYPKISKTLPQFADGAEHVKSEGKDYGCPIIMNASHEKEMCQRHSFTRDYHHSDEQTKFNPHTDLDPTPVQ